MYILNCKGKAVALQKPMVMGIINVTPDSFFEASQHTSIDHVLQTAEKMIQEGATFLDIGGQSTKPNSVKISVEEELNRVIPAITAIAKNFPSTILSIDTYYSKVAAEAVAAGAAMVNDVSAGTLDENMITTVATLNVPFIAMHMQGTPQNMQQNPTYKNVTDEVLAYFIEKKVNCIKAGIKDIIIDPGFGFGKTIEHNYTLLQNLHVFNMLELPVLVGLSRKSMIYKVLQTTPEQALNGTTVVNTIALLKGAHILRVHDVKAAIECIKIVENLPT